MSGPSTTMSVSLSRNARMNVEIRRSVPLLATGEQINVPRTSVEFAGQSAPTYAAFSR